MPDYAPMYRALFNAQTDAISGLEAITENLKRTQQKTEQMYIDAPEPIVTILDTKPEGEKEDGNQ